MNPSIFKTYDIRGKAGIDITHDTAQAIGTRLGLFLRQNYQVGQIVIGYDIRHSSHELRNGLADGLKQNGLDVLDIGLVATPVLYWVAYRLGVAGVMITASHLGKEYNGFKLLVGSRPLWGDDIRALRDMTYTESDLTPGGGYTASSGINDAYIQYLATSFRPTRSLKIVVDAGNGMGGPYAPRLLDQLGHTVIPLFCDPDGDFPNHHPNPEKAENMRDLAAKVVEVGADVGLAFDGDSDRVGVVDEKGQFISADKAMAWLAQDVMTRNPGGKFVGDVLSSQVVFDAVRNAGGHPILWQSGHARVKAKMQAEGAILGGESSGHMFFADRFYGFDDGIYAGGRIVELLAEQNRPLSEIMAALPHYFTTPEYRPHCPDEQKTTVIDGVKAHLGDLPCVDVDGIRVLYPNGWGLLRASGTEPVLSLRFEARAEADAWAYKNHLVGLLKQVYPQVEDF
ncbi:MAG: phosphomannomutase/phosphoglucomutase [Chloroflexi bacterium]|nr:phosphomannomutase/phosphoglucomutase [Chloroflexota bacterium]